MQKRTYQQNIAIKQTMEFVCTRAYTLAHPHSRTPAKQGQRFWMSILYAYWCWIRNFQVEIMQILVLAVDVVVVVV